MTDFEKTVNTSRLIRDIEEGVIIIDNIGTISNINPKAYEILEIKKAYIGKKYISLIEDDKNKNDTFHQLIIDAVTDKKTVHKKRIRYTSDSTEKVLYIASSVIRNDNDEQPGILISFDDVTAEEKLKFNFIQQVHNVSSIGVYSFGNKSMWIYN